MALGPILTTSSDVPHDNTDIALLTELLKRNIEFAAREYVTRAIAPPELTLETHQYMQQRDLFACRCR